MGLFAKKQTPTGPTYECKLCGHSFSENAFDKEQGICRVCAVTADSFISDFLMPVMKASLESAREEPNPDSKVVYFRSLLDALYEYKVKYHDNGINLIEQDVDELIDRVLDLVSRVRLA